jgi:hypothetical protein
LVDLVVVVVDDNAIPRVGTCVGSRDIVASGVWYWCCYDSSCSSSSCSSGDIRSSSRSRIIWVVIITKKFFHLSYFTQKCYELFRQPSAITTRKTVVVCALKVESVGRYRETGQNDETVRPFFLITWINGVFHLVRPSLVLLRLIPRQTHATMIQMLHI